MPLASLVLVVALAQADPPPASQDPPAKTAEPAPPLVVAYSDAAARKALTDFKAVSPKASLVERMTALEALVRGSHVDLVPVLDKVVRRDSSVAVRKKAATALGWQPAKKAYPVVVALLDGREVEQCVELVEPLVGALASVGYTSKDWPRLESFFRAGYGADRTGLQRAIIALATQHKEKLAIPVLLENFDEPKASDDVHGADNPPAEYWEARWKAWRAWRDELRAAVQVITGQKFGSAAEARAWLTVNGPKLGIKKL